MPKYTAEIDGHKYTIEAATPEEAMAAGPEVERYHDARMAKRKAATEADQAATRERFKQDEANRSLTERVATNLGAGFDTAWQGAKQLGHMVGLGSGVSDEELEESRRIKKGAAETMPGGSLVQLAGEIAPTAVLPVGASGSLLKAAVMGGLGGAASGALQPVLSSESRTANTLLGAAGGAAAPVAVAGVRKMLPLALGGSGAANAEQRAGKHLVKALGEQDARAAVGKLKAPNASQITGDIPLTTAEKLGDARLARVEMQARKQAPEVFTELGRRQNEAVFDAAINRAGVEGNDQFLKVAKNARDIVSNPMREEVLASAGKFSHVAEPLQKNVDALRSVSAVGSSGDKLADLVERNIQANANPKQLHGLRKMLADKLNGPRIPGDDVSAVVKGAETETRNMIAAIDARLNEAAARKGGSAAPWSDWLATHTQMSKPVSSARAQQQISEHLNQPGARLEGVSPETTRSVLKRAMDKFGTNAQNFDRLTPAARSRYDELLQFLQKQEELASSFKTAGTMGGGSQTSFSDAVGKFALDTASEIPFVGALVKPGMKRIEEATQRELVQMAADPSRAAAGIQAALQGGQPLSRAQQAFLALARGGGAGAGLALAQPGTE